MGSDTYLKLISTIRLDLLELFGSGYVIEHCVAAFSDLQRERAFQAYVTDCLKMVAENTSKPYGGKYPGKRFADVWEKMGKPKDKRTAEDIISHMLRKINGIGEGGDANEPV